MKSFLDRFWEKVDIQGENDCWNWKANKSHGYGLLFSKTNKSPYKAHQISWVLANKLEIPKKMDICHKCDNPSCVNPKHLFLETHSKNMNDAYKKGRAKFYHHGKGEDNNTAQFTNVEISHIRSDYTLGMTIKELQQKYRSTNIKRIVRNKAYIDPEYVPINANARPRLSRRKIPITMICEVQKLHGELKSSRKVAKAFGVSKATILLIMRKEELICKN